MVDPNRIEANMTGGVVLFSQGHLIWIAISIAIIVAGSVICRVVRPKLYDLMKVAFGLGILSEVVKVFAVAKIVPVIDPVIVQNEDVLAVEYVSLNDYTPYIAMEHMPLELCSLYIVFMFLAIVVKSTAWKKGLYAVMYASGTIGGLMGIFFASIAADFSTVHEYFASARAWQYFIYHAIIVTVSLYLGSCDEAGLEFSDFKKAVMGIILLDIPTFYLNSVFSSEIYKNDELVGVSHRINFFSSYVSPFGMKSPEKSAWILYVLIRAVLALICIIAVFTIPAISARMRRRAKNDG